LANHDAEGTGPKESFKIGRDRVYTKNSFVEWLIAQAKPVQPKKERGETAL
jgi:hypothetical protein